MPILACRIPSRPSSSCTVQKKVSGGWGSLRWRTSNAVDNTSATPERSSAPRAVVFSAGTIRLPRRTGLAPTHSGTVSIWAIISRRGPRCVPGRRQTRLPTSPPRGLRRWAWSDSIVPSGAPTRRSCSVMNSTTFPSCPLGPEWPTVQEAAFQLDRGRAEVVVLGQRVLASSSGWGPWRVLIHGVQSRSTASEALESFPDSRIIAQVSRMNWRKDPTPLLAINPAKCFIRYGLRLRANAFSFTNTTLFS